MVLERFRYLQMVDELNDPNIHCSDHVSTSTSFDTHGCFDELWF